MNKFKQALKKLNIMKLQLDSKLIFKGTLATVFFFLMVYSISLLEINITFVNAILQVLMIPFMLAIGVLLFLNTISFVKNKKENKSLLSINMVLLLGLTFLIVRSFIHV